MVKATWFSFCQPQEHYFDAATFIPKAARCSMGDVVSYYAIKTYRYVTPMQAAFHTSTGDQFSMF